MIHNNNHKNKNPSLNVICRKVLCVLVKFNARYVQIECLHPFFMSTQIFGHGFIKWLELAEPEKEEKKNNNSETEIYL